MPHAAPPAHPVRLARGETLPPGRGRTERTARAFFWGAALAVALAALAVWVIPHLVVPTAREEGALSWRPTAIGAAVIVGLLLWEVRGALVVLVAGIALIEVPALVVRGVSLTTLANVGQTLLVGLVLGFVGAVILRLSRSADVAAAARADAARAAASARGEQTARSHAAALVHDEVLSVLVLAASQVGVDRGRLADQAGLALQALGGITDDAPPTDSLVVVLRRVALGVDPEALVVVRLAGEGQAFGLSGPRLSLPTLRAMSGAMRQGLENSLRHAGAAARRSVEISVEPSAVRVVLSDDGVGFDPLRVATDRLGLRTSVVRAMREVGGDAVVRSSPGAGTRVELLWPASAQGAAVQTPAERTGWGGVVDPPLVRSGAGALVAAFAASQVLLAVLAMRTALWWWAPAAVLLLLFLSVGLLLSPFAERLSTWRSVTVVALVGLGVFIGVAGAPFAVGDLWFAGAGAFVLVALAFRQRPFVAAAGGLFISAILLVAGTLRGAPALLIAAVTVRPLGVTALAVALALVGFWLLRRTTAATASAVEETAQTAWEESARAELAVRGREVLELVSATLTVIARGEPLDTHTRDEAQALEGLLRDRIRAGNLAAEPLLTAAMQARQRGVDVVLLDDLLGELPDGIELEVLVHRAATALESATQRATVRLLPAGRDAVASLVVDGEAIRFTREMLRKTTDFGG